ncbi:MAG TPA: serine hydrolase [Gammaproteobacteria bacterium]|nr:serine hydrolase [Luteimonas sp.]HRO26370.1 serine hydrolase [Luteimonas sp.]HRP35808.1 serine hydrolase [Gammaproteobacteria bacterium]HRP71301.1 serine hydrolase [Luteimonas sp.]
MALCLLCPAASSAQAATSVERIDAEVRAAIERYRLPGIAVGVIERGEVVFARGYGEAAAGTGDPVTAETMFKIASNSKAMTAALLARLVDQGKLEWTDPVVKHLPDFRMHDDWVTREMQVRDLLIHNSGLGAGAGDLMLWPEPNLFTRADVIRGLRHLKPVYSFRSRYAYDNTLYIVAGEVAAAAGGAPYDELVRRELFEPLGLDRCRVGEWRRDTAGSVAQPHRRGEDGRPVVSREDGEVIPDVPMMAAGGIRCSLDDMLAWVRMWLQPERFGLDGEGRPWLSARQREEVWKAHMPMPLSRRMRDWDGSHYSAYGYGWRLTDVDGTWKVSHTGTLSGMYSAVTLLPEQDAGFVILINGNADEARTVLSQVLVKHFTRPDDPSLDVAHYAALLAAGRESSTGPASAQATVADTRHRATPDALAPFTGRYRDPWFGEVAICAEAAGVSFRSAKSPRLNGSVMHEGDRLLVDWHDLGADADAWLSFVQPEAGPPRLTMAKVDPEADFSYDYEDLAFERIGACTLP